MGEDELHHLISGCMKQDRKSQKMLYKAFYGFSMAICLRYASDRDEAASVVNQGFFKAFPALIVMIPPGPLKPGLAKL